MLSGKKSPQGSDRSSSVDHREKIPFESLTLEREVASLRDRLKGVVVCFSRSWGGLEQVAAQDALEVASQGLNVKVLCLEGSPIHQNLLEKKEVVLETLPVLPRNYFDFSLKAEFQRQFQIGTNLIHTHQPSLLGSIVP